MAAGVEINTLNSDAKPFSAWEDVAAASLNTVNQAEDSQMTPKRKESLPFNRLVPNFTLAYGENSMPVETPGVF